MHLLASSVWKHQLHDLEEFKASYTLGCSSFSCQDCSEQVQEHLLHTGGTLKPSCAISIENLKPKGMGKVQVKLSEYYDKSLSLTWCSLSFIIIHE